MNYNAEIPIYLQVIHDLKRGIGTFVMEEETMFETIKKEMAEELLSSFIHEMQDLGFEKDDIISKIADYKEERR